MNHGGDKYFDLTVLDDVDVVVQTENVTRSHVAHRVANLRIGLLKQLIQRRR